MTAKRKRLDPANIEPHDALTPGEVARLFGVSPKTVTRWVQEGRIPCFHLPSKPGGRRGHRRYRGRDVLALLEDPPPS